MWRNWVVLSGFKTNGPKSVHYKNTLINYFYISLSEKTKIVVGPIGSKRNSSDAKAILFVNWTFVYNFTILQRPCFRRQHINRIFLIYVVWPLSRNLNFVPNQMTLLLHFEYLFHWNIQMFRIPCFSIGVGI